MPNVDTRRSEQRAYSRPPWVVVHVANVIPRLRAERGSLHDRVKRSSMRNIKSRITTPHGGNIYTRPCPPPHRPPTALKARLDRGMRGVQRSGKDSAAVRWLYDVRAFPAPLPPPPIALLNARVPWRTVLDERVLECVPRGWMRRRIFLSQSIFVY